MDYIRFNGELLIHTTIILIGGVILTGLTYNLFDLIDPQMGHWYMKNVVVYGVAAAPLVATFLVDRILTKHFKIAPLLARIFTPFFLLTVVSYLLIMVVKQKSPYHDREFLVAFNGLLLTVLALSVFSISERIPEKSAGFGDMVNIGLVVMTLVIDIFALSAILFRLASYGFTPNRIAVLGANLLICFHLSGITYHYVCCIRRGHLFAPLERWIVGYIPIYTIWSVIVTFGFPLLFDFR